MTTRLFVLIACSAILNGALAQFSFDRDELTSSMHFAYDAAAGDIDGDGDQDIVVSLGNPFGSSFDQSRIGWYENTGDMESLWPFHVIHNGSYGVVETHDYDGDGDQDVIFSSFLPEGLYLLENQGNGSFAEASLLNSDYLELLEFLDLDEDGIDDMVTGHGQEPELSWYQGTETGFEEKELIYSGEEGTFKRIALGDIDVDGDRDMLLVHEDSVIWLSNEGAPVYQRQAKFTHSQQGISYVGFTDIQPDGIEDIIYGRNGMLYLQENDGLGNLTQHEVLDPSWGGSNIQDAAIGYMNSDDRPDILTTGTSLYYHQKCSCSLNIHDDEVFSYDESGNQIELVDFNGDGHLDVLARSFANGTIKIFEHDGNWSPEFEERNRTKLIEGYIQMDVQDFDGDGYLDVLTLEDYPHYFSIYRNQGDGSFAPHARLNTGQQYDSFIVEDINGDGLVDVAFDNSYEIRIYLNNGENLSYDSDFDITFPFGNLASADFDSDGDMDIFVGHGDGMYSYENVLGGSFVNEVLLTDQPAFDIQTADFDDDGFIDFILEDNNDDLYYLLNEGGEGLSEPTLLLETVGGYIAQTSLDDMDADGDMDVVVLYGGQFVIVENTDDGFEEHFVAEPSSFTHGTPTEFSLADMDSDGALDLIFLYTPTERFGWKRNLGDFEFSSDEILDDRVNWPARIFVEDFDMDGAMDIITTSTEDDQLILFRGSNVFGCMDPSACNYNPDADMDNGACLYGYEGCLEPSALNFDPMATCADNSCNFSITGTVFYDSNENDIQDEGEAGIPGIQVELNGGDIIVYSDSEGAFNASLGDGSHTLAVNNGSSPYPFNTSPDTLTVTLTEGNPDVPMTFGLLDIEPDYSLDAVFGAFVESPYCESYASAGIYFQNTGNQPITGQVRLLLDTLLNETDLFYPLDSVGTDGALHFSFDTLYPGQDEQILMHLLFPSSDFIGAYIVNEVEIRGFAEGEQVAYDELIAEHILECSYDPNDKTVYPQGYQEEGYIYEEETLTYRIRFQNTGTAPAQDVVIYDTLSTHLDLSTFELFTSSHNPLVAINPETRVIQFLHEDIFLPDSISDPEGSQGEVFFRINLVDDLEVSTEIVNRAAIYFDNNDPIITNAALNTIYDCILFEPEVVREGNTLTVSEGEEFQWYLDGAVIPGADQMSYVGTQDGTYSVEVSNYFECTQLIDGIEFVLSSIHDWAGGEVQLYPNPAGDRVTIEFEQQSPVEIELCSIQGRVLKRYSVTGPTQVLDLSELAAGSYLLVCREIGRNTSVTLPLTIE